MRRLILSALLAAGVAAPALAAERSFPAGGFDRVANSTPFDVYVHTGRAPSVHAVGSDEALKRLRVDVRGGELRVGTLPNSWFTWRSDRAGKVRIDVTVPTLSGANLSGPGNLWVDTVRTRAFSSSLSGPGNITIGALEAGEVALHLSGPGDITASGHAGRGTLSLSGPGNMHIGKLALRDATISLSGPGNMDATVTGTADVRLSGPGDVRVRGGARCSVHKSGPGDVTCG